MNAPFQYVGSELELFAAAANWKGYLAAQIRPHLGGDVLEVGAGIGATARALCDGRQRSWTCLEPDPDLAARVPDGGPFPVPLRVEVGTLGAVPPGERFDAVLYVDVLEHIEDAAAELRRAAARLRPGGRLVVLAPAHPWLYSPFDRAIGHFRRYTRASLAAEVPTGFATVRLVYLDSLGMVLSLGNRLVCRQAMPTARQIAFWDRRVVPLSRLLDPLTFGRVGKSVLGIWSAPSAEGDSGGKPG